MLARGEGRECGPRARTPVARGSSATSGGRESVLAVGKRLFGRLGRVEGLARHDDVWLDALARERLLDGVEGGLAEEGVVLGDEAQVARGERLHRAVRAVDRGDLDVFAGREARLFDRLDGAEAHLVVLRE